MRRVYLLGVLAAVGLARPARAAPAIVPSASPQPETLQDDPGGRWAAGGVAYGVQNVLFMGQPRRPQLLAEGRAGGNRTEGYVVAAGLDQNPWGMAGIRHGVLDGRRRRVGITVDYFMSLPSRATFFAGGMLTVGKSFRRAGWTAGTQLGMAAAPTPNQRPVGPNFAASLQGAGWWRPWPFLTLGLDTTISPFTTTFLPAASFEAAGVTSRRWLRGLRVSIVEPMNLTYVGAVVTAEVGLDPVRVPPRVSFSTLLPAAFVRYAVGF